jgi:hypothetical protein
LVRAIAYRFQEQAFGGLKPGTFRLKRGSQKQPLPGIQRYMRRLTRSAFLAPKIVEMISAASQPPDLTA